MSSNTEFKNKALGVLQGFIAFFIWGILPLYWAVLSNVSPMEIVLHRIIWCAVALSLYFAIKGQLVNAFYEMTRNRRILCLLTINSMLIGANWFVYVWAIAEGYVLETSLGYFINPILSILLGFLVLKERLNFAQKFAVGLVSVAILQEVLRSGQIPWIGLFLAVSFATYGLIKKMSRVGSLASLWFESLLCAVPSVMYLGYLVYTGLDSFTGSDWGTEALLVASGPITALPLLFFGLAATKLNLATIGFMQFLAPTLQFILALCYFKEPLDANKLTMFFYVWLAVGLYLLGTQWTNIHRLPLLRALTGRIFSKTS